MYDLIRKFGPVVIAKLPVSCFQCVLIRRRIVLGTNRYWSERAGACLVQEQVVIAPISSTQRVLVDNDFFFMHRRRILCTLQFPLHFY
jgi:hypothetical protein